MKIMIVDDHALFRDGLSFRLKEIDSEANILHAPTFHQAFELADINKDIDIVIIDLDMPDMKWEEGVEKLREQLPNGIFIVISASEEVKDIKKALESGIKGYIPKRSEPKIMYNALKLIFDGGTYLPPALLKAEEKTFKPINSNGKEKVLTNRQFQVLDLIAQGKSNKQIAYEIGVSEATVKLHINALLRSLHVNNRTQAVVTAQKLGII